nr:MAG TPA: hypothetical protein [Caudoviricetes sp.]
MFSPSILLVKNSLYQFLQRNFYESMFCNSK